MSRNQRGGGVQERSTEVLESGTSANGVSGEQPNPIQPEVPTNVAIFHSFHPKVGVADRVSYKVPGVKGAIYMFLTLFKDGIAPQTLKIGADLAPPTVDDRESKAEKAALKLQEKAAKLQEKLAAQQAKAEAAAAKAQASLDAAKAKVASTEVKEEVQS